MLLLEISNSLHSIESVSVLDSELRVEEFCVTFKIEETEIGWLALEAVARVCSLNNLRLTAEAHDEHRSLFFRMVGAASQLTSLRHEMNQLANPADGTDILKPPHSEPPPATNSHANS